MKTIKLILIMMLLPLAFTACSDDDAMSPSVVPTDFLQVTNRTAKVTNDGTYYILNEYIEHSGVQAKPCVFIVDRQEDAAKIAALNGVTDVIFSGVGQKTDYRPASAEADKEYYMILLTEVKVKE